MIGPLAFIRGSIRWAPDPIRIAGLPAILAVLGCAKPAPSVSSEPDRPPPPSVGALPGTTSPTSPAIEPRAAETRPGLVVERLRLKVDRSTLDALLLELPDLPTNPADIERWRREGFLLKVIDPSTLARLEASLEPGLAVSRTWHGEATGWRSASRRRLGRGAAMLIDGRARPVDDRILSLEMRGWSIPRTDGAVLQVEFVPLVIGNIIDPLAPPRPPGELRGETLAPAVETSLGADRIILVASVPRRRATPPPDPGPEAEETSRIDAAGRPIGAGPEAVLPPTIASWLIDDPYADERGILLIRGRPHPSLDLPETASAGTELQQASENGVSKAGSTDARYPRESP